MAAEHEMTETAYAESFIAEHGLKVDALNTSVHGGRAYYTITVSNKRGSVQFTEYSPGAGQDVYDDLRVLADIITFVSSLIEDGDKERRALDAAPLLIDSLSRNHRKECTVTYFTMQQIKDANRAAGYHWFDTSITGFFGSRYGRTVYGGHYFIESSPFAFNGPRVYSIREAMDDGTIDTVCVKNPYQPYLSENVYETRAQAVAAIKRLLKESPA